MVYATYGYYRNEYCGKAIPQNDFQRMILKASQYIDCFTFGRITEGDVKTFPSISLCACDMAESIYQILEKDKKSENTDGYSVTYITERADGNTVEDTLRKKMYSIAEVYLSNTGFLYIGC